MTIASYITIVRIGLVPVFVWLAWSYGRTVVDQSADESLRWAAIGVFLCASVLDGVDGAIARYLNQRTSLGANLDPIADKLLLLSAVVVLTFVPWGEKDWRIPSWFGGIVLARDVIILGGVLLIYHQRGHVIIHPHWTGKVCTVLQMVVLGWVMLKWTTISPLVPVSVASCFLVASGWAYSVMGYRQLTDP